LALRNRARGAREETRTPAGEAHSGQGRAESAPVVVVGLGASAGGITALEKFFEAVAPDSGGAFVVVVHLDPTHASSIAEILARHTSMPVSEAVHGRLVEPDHVYVIPPNSILKIQRNRLVVLPPSEPRGFRMPIDHFFSSLGEDRRQRAVGILFSGTGSDGTIGLLAIKSSGGLTLAQDIFTLEFGIDQLILADTSATVSSGCTISSCGTNPRRTARPPHNHCGHPRAFQN